jgi:hypothetical protein
MTARCARRDLPDRREHLCATRRGAIDRVPEVGDPEEERDRLVALTAELAEQALGVEIFRPLGVDRDATVLGRLSEAPAEDLAVERPRGSRVSDRDLEEDEGTGHGASDR